MEIFIQAGIAVLVIGIVVILIWWLGRKLGKEPFGLESEEHVHHEPEYDSAPILEEAERKAHQDAALLRKHILAQAEKDAFNQAQEKLLVAMQRSASTLVSDASTVVVELPSEEIKAKIIGREGRNIKSFEQVTGVNLVVDERPCVVVISSFDPQRREVARLTLLNLIVDGRIHPGRISELFERAQEQIEDVKLEAAKDACKQLGIKPFHIKVMEALGALKFRYSYGQNVLNHSIEVGLLAREIAEEIGLDQTHLAESCLLHDIGKGLPLEAGQSHALAGMQFLKQFGINDTVLNAVGSHHREIEPNSPVVELLIAADTLSASRPGARKESVEKFSDRLTDLEAIATGFAGVSRAFAVQSGREVRVIVNPSEMDDAGASRLAQQIARSIQQSPNHPGNVKVTVVREVSFTEVAL